MVKKFQQKEISWTRNRTRDHHRDRVICYLEMGLTLGLSRHRFAREQLTIAPSKTDAGSNRLFCLLESIVFFRLIKVNIAGSEKQAEGWALVVVRDQEQPGSGEAISESGNHP